MTPRESPFQTLQSTCFRAVDPAFREHALAGSRAAGRYSRASEPTLYLSASREGVEAAMIAHRDSRSSALETLAVHVDAHGIADLRSPEPLAALGIAVADAAAPWQDIVATGGTPPSWRVRDQLVAAGANGLIDPSRKRPDLWHLVLFRWNEPGAPVVRLTDA